MEYSHPIDRLGVKMRPALVVLAAMCFPVFLISYGLMLHHALTTWPAWASAAMVFANLTVLSGLAALLDIRRERFQSRPDGQS